MIEQSLSVTEYPSLPGEREAEYGLTRQLQMLTMFLCNYNNRTLFGEMRKYTNNLAAFASLPIAYALIVKDTINTYSRCN